MTAVKMEQRAIPVNVQGELKWSPGIRLGDKGDFNLVAHQGRIIAYDTPEEARAYFED